MVQILQKLLLAHGHIAQCFLSDVEFVDFLGELLNLDDKLLALTFGPDNGTVLLNRSNGALEQAVLTAVFF